MKGIEGTESQSALVSWVVHFLDMAPTDCPALIWAVQVEKGAVLEQIC